MFFIYLIMLQNPTVPFTWHNIFILIKYQLHLFCSVYLHIMKALLGWCLQFDLKQNNIFLGNYLRRALANMTTRKLDFVNMNMNILNKHGQSHIKEHDCTFILSLLPYNLQTWYKLCSILYKWN